MFLPAKVIIPFISWPNNGQRSPGISLELATSFTSALHIHAAKIFITNVFSSKSGNVFVTISTIPSDKFADRYSPIR